MIIHISIMSTIFRCLSKEMQIRRGLFCDDMCMLLQPNQFGEGGSGRPARNQYGELLDAGVLAGPDDQQSEYVNQLAPSRGLDGRVQTGAPARPFRESQLGRQAQAPARPVRPANRHGSDDHAPAAECQQCASSSNISKQMFWVLHCQAS